MRWRAGIIFAVAFGLLDVFMAAFGGWFRWVQILFLPVAVALDRPSQNSGNDAAWIFALNVMMFMLLGFIVGQLVAKGLDRLAARLDERK
jgi:hypothetical protein